MGHGRLDVLPGALSGASTGLLEEIDTE